MAGASAVVARAARVNYRDYSRCLPDYLSALVREAYESRNAAIRELNSAAAVEARQKWVRDTLWKLAGGMPERTPLNQRSMGGFER